MKKRPNILTIAGFDPSNGAGLTADIKTMEALKCYGLSVCTANTIQNDITFKACYWTPLAIIKEQINVLFERFPINYVKIGIVENWVVLNDIIDLLIEKNTKIKIILDPVLTSSSEYDFHSNNQSKEFGIFDQTEFDIVLSKIYMLTPNYKEIQQLYPEKNIEETIEYISNKTNLFLKGGHNDKAIGVDTLFTGLGKKYNLNPKTESYSEKHGSGCVLSSAITAFLAMNYPLLKACVKGKGYTEKVLSSNKSLLGYHG
ncbi:MAG: hydroxymethylpyrimidine/phosphomethylpyrimidine kinase [Cellulophaga sp.]